MRAMWQSLVDRGLGDRRIVGFVGVGRQRQDELTIMDSAEPLEVRCVFAMHLARPSESIGDRIPEWLKELRGCLEDPSLPSELRDFLVRHLDAARSWRRPKKHGKRQGKSNLSKKSIEDAVRACNVGEVNLAMERLADHCSGPTPPGSLTPASLIRRVPVHRLLCCPDFQEWLLESLRLAEVRADIKAVAVLALSSIGRFDWLDDDDWLKPNARIFKKKVVWLSIALSIVKVREQALDESLSKDVRETAFRRWKNACRVLAKRQGLQMLLPFNEPLECQQARSLIGFDLSGPRPTVTEAGTRSSNSAPMESDVVDTHTPHRFQRSLFEIESDSAAFGKKPLSPKQVRAQGGATSGKNKKPASSGHRTPARKMKDETLIELTVKLMKADMASVKS